MEAAILVIVAPSFRDTPEALHNVRRDDVSKCSLGSDERANEGGADVAP